MEAHRKIGEQANQTNNKSSQMPLRNQNLCEFIQLKVYDQIDQLID